MSNKESKAPKNAAKILDGVIFDFNSCDWDEDDSPDNDPVIADWAKSGSDFAFARDAEGMRAYLKDIGISLTSFKCLPIYKRDKDKYPWFTGL